MVNCTMKTLFTLKGAMFSLLLLTTLAMLLMTSILFEGSSDGRDKVLGLHTTISKSVREEETWWRSVPEDTSSLRGLKVQHSKHFGPRERASVNLDHKFSSAGVPTKLDGRLPGKAAGSMLPRSGELSLNNVLQHEQSVVGQETGKASKSGPQRECKDSLCTNYLTPAESNGFFDCQHSSSKRYQRFLDRRQSSNSTKKLIHSLRPTEPGGALATGDCKFKDGQGP